MFLCSSLQQMNLREREANFLKAALKIPVMQVPPITEFTEYISGTVDVGNNCHRENTMVSNVSQQTVAQTALQKVPPISGISEHNRGIPFNWPRFLPDCGSVITPPYPPPFIGSCPPDTATSTPPPPGFSGSHSDLPRFSSIGAPPGFENKSMPQPETFRADKSSIAENHNHLKIEKSTEKKIDNGNVQKDRDVKHRDFDGNREQYNDNKRCHVDYRRSYNKNGSHRSSNDSYNNNQSKLLKNDAPKPESKHRSNSITETSFSNPSAIEDFDNSQSEKSDRRQRNCHETKSRGSFSRPRINRNNFKNQSNGNDRHYEEQSKYWAHDDRKTDDRSRKPDDQDEIKNRDYPYDCNSSYHSTTGRSRRRTNYGKNLYYNSKDSRPDRSNYQSNFEKEDLDEYSSQNDHAFVEHSNRTSYRNKPPNNANHKNNYPRKGSSEGNNQHLNSERKRPDRQVNNARQSNQRFNDNNSNYHSKSRVPRNDRQNNHKNEKHPEHLDENRTYTSNKEPRSLTNEVTDTESKIIKIKEKESRTENSKGIPGKPLITESKKKFENNVNNSHSYQKNSKFRDEKISQKSHQSRKHTNQSEQPQLRDKSQRSHGDSKTENLYSRPSSQSSKRKDEEDHSRSRSKSSKHDDEYSQTPHKSRKSTGSFEHARSQDRRERSCSESEKSHLKTSSQSKKKNKSKKGWNDRKPTNYNYHPVQHDPQRKKKIRQKQPLYVSNQNYEPVIREIEGDLFQAGDEYSLAHCVGSDFIMSAGIARDFKELFGGVQELKSQNKTVGEVAVLPDKTRFIFYLITKKYTYGKPTMRSFTNTIIYWRKICDQLNVKKLAIPRIGCGLDKLDWDSVKDILYENFRDSGIEILVHVI